MSGFSLRPGLDLTALADAFQSEGRLQIPDFLRHDGAMTLFRELAQSHDWRLAINQGNETRDYGEAEMAAWPSERKAALEREVVERGRHGFQFRYDAIRLPSKDAVGEPAHSLVGGFVDFLSSPEMIGLLRTLTGASDIMFADGHASRYMPGHFLTAHDDLNVQMGRRVAYVLNLTPQWRPDWGGLLLFYDERGNVARGFTPAFNVLNIFRVPQPHNVTWVTPLAAAPRYAVTGWLRVGEPD